MNEQEVQALIARLKDIFQTKDGCDKRSEETERYADALDKRLIIVEQNTKAMLKVLWLIASTLIVGFVTALCAIVCK